MESARQIPPEAIHLLETISTQSDNLFPFFSPISQVSLVQFDVS
jgi:hypothetical protein